MVTVLAPAHGTGGGGFGDLLAEEHPVIAVQRRVLDESRVRVLSGTTVVLQQPGGPSVLTQAGSVP